jgi:hypothetical protein
MSEKASDSRSAHPGPGPEPTAAPQASAPAGAAAGDVERPSYEGSSVPWWLVLLFLGYLAWAVYYLLRYVPASWAEWFAKGGK